MYFFSGKIVCNQKDNHGHFGKNSVFGFQNKKWKMIMDIEIQPWKQVLICKSTVWFQPKTHGMLIGVRHVKYFLYLGYTQEQNMGISTP